MRLFCYGLTGVGVMGAQGDECREEGLSATILGVGGLGVPIGGVLVSLFL